MPPPQAQQVQQQQTQAAAPTPQQQRDAIAETDAKYFPPGGDRRPVILYDGVCALCNWGVNVVLDWDAPGTRQFQFRLAALQSPAGRALLRRAGRAPDDISSIVLVEAGGVAFTKSEAVRRIGARLGAPFPLLAALARPVPLALRDFLYEQVADNRYNLFGRTPECRLRDAGELEGRFLVE